MPPATACTEAPRALLFDLGGVLLELHGERSFAYWAARAGCASEGLRARFVQDAAYHAFERGEIDAAEYFAALSAGLGIALTHVEWLAGWNAMLGEPFAELTDIVQALHGRLPLYLFSNTNAAHHAAWQPRCAPLLSSFSGCFLSHELGLRKPDAAAFTAVVARIGVPAEAVLFVDDLEANVQGARSAGLAATLVQTPAELRIALRAAGLS